MNTASFPVGPTTATDPAEPSADARPIQGFYNEHPFPDFTLGKYVLREDLYRYANPYTLLLDAHLPRNARIVDAGCGTGQLTCLLALRGRKVVGYDFSASSLSRAEALRNHLDLGARVSFHQADLETVRRPQDEARYDVVMVNGVIPCLRRPGKVVNHLIAELAAPGAIVVVGLYHSWGRLMFRLRRALSPGRPQAPPSSLRSMMVKEESDPAKVESWFADQIEPVFERSYGVGRVETWLRAAGVEPVRCLPSLPGDPPLRAGLFAETDSPRRGLAAKLVELSWTITLRNTGGYFVVIGRVDRANHTDQANRTEV